MQEQAHPDPAIHGPGVIQFQESAGNPEFATIAAALLAARRFDIFNPPAPAVPVFRLSEALVATPGNLLAIQAKSKEGKTAFIGAMIASTMSPEGGCLGVSSSNPNSFAVVHFDTEQSPAAHHALGLTVLRRAGLDEPPKWFYSYRIADLAQPMRRKFIKFEMERAAQQHGGLLSMFLDGGADFLVDPNDTMESFGFVDELHQLAIQYLAVIPCVIHENPGSVDGKTRGHFGSQLERKAESNIRLSKDTEGVTVVFTERSRHAHIPKEYGPCFHYDETQRMHVSCGHATKAKKGAQTKTKEDLKALVPMTGSISKNALISMAKSVKDIGEKKADGFLAELLEAKDLFRWEIPRPKTNHEVRISRQEQTLL